MPEPGGVNSTTNGKLPLWKVKWGSLVKMPIFLEAPTTMVEAYPLPSPMTRWSFPESAIPQLPAFFTSIGLPQSLVAALSQSSAQMIEDGYIHLFPPATEVAGLDSETRAKLYIELGKYEINEFHHDPVRILTDTVEEWYRSSNLRSEIVETIAKWSYRKGDLIAFSDLPLLLNLVSNETEAREIYKRVTRTRGYLVKLYITDNQEWDLVRNYWSNGGQTFRLMSLEPIVNSIQELPEPMHLDISHLIPSLPRKLIYTYPGSSYAIRGTLPDCHWTSLNFFNSEPHPYLLDSRLSTNRVLEDYTPVEPPYNYGDILFYIRNDDGNAYHSCVYLADDLVFTKNGRNALVPWMISSLDDVSRIYFSNFPGHIQAYRKKDNYAGCIE